MKQRLNGTISVKMSVALCVPACDQLWRCLSTESEYRPFQQANVTNTRKITTSIIRIYQNLLTQIVKNKHLDQDSNI